LYTTFELRSGYTKVKTQLLVSYKHLEPHPFSPNFPQSDLPLLIGDGK